MPRVAPTLYDFVEADNGDYLKVAEAVFRIFDRQDWLRVNRARARIKVLRRQVRHRRAAQAWSTRSSKGDWVDERDFDVDPILFVDDEEAERARPRRVLRARRTATCSEFERFCA